MSSRYGPQWQETVNYFANLRSTKQSSGANSPVDSPSVESKSETSSLASSVPLPLPQQVIQRMSRHERKKLKRVEFLQDKLGSDFDDGYRAKINSSSLSKTSTLGVSKELSKLDFSGYGILYYCPQTGPHSPKGPQGKKKKRGKFSQKNKIQKFNERSNV